MEKLLLTHFKLLNDMELKKTKKHDLCRKNNICALPLVSAALWQCIICTIALLLA